MAPGKLELAASFDSSELHSAPQSGADFLTNSNVIEFPIKPKPIEILDVILKQDFKNEEGRQADTVSGLREYLQDLIPKYFESFRQSEVAIAYANDFHEELDIDKSELSPDQKSVLTLAKLYLSGVSSLGRLDLLVFTRWRHGGKSGR